MVRYRRTQDYGVVAVLDALGARDFSNSETARFFESRRVVLKLLDDKADSEAVRLEEEEITTFIFNDTVLIVLRSLKGGPIADLPLRAFLRVLRKFLVDSMAHSILFRGAFSIGGFLMDSDSNTIMGEAVNDAAAWYDKSNWVGLHATPRTYLEITRRMEGGGDHVPDWNSCVVEYEVPTKGSTPVPSKAINWPKMILMPKSSPRLARETPRQCVLRHLSSHRVPFGTENKYYETLRFFDYVATIANPVGS